jgi:hypothetical protein
VEDQEPPVTQQLLCFHVWTLLVVTPAVQYKIALMPCLRLQGWRPTIRERSGKGVRWNIKKSSDNRWRKKGRKKRRAREG